MAKKHAGGGVLTFWAKQSQLRILVTGKTGQGKSALINTILGDKVAEEGGGAKRCTTEVTMYCKIIQGVPVEVFISHGLQDCTQNEEELYIKGMKEKCKELSLVIYCTKMTNPRLTDDDKHAMMKLTQAFGENFWKYSIIALTFANEEHCDRKDDRDEDTGSEPDCDDEEGWKALEKQRFKGRLKIWENKLKYFLIKEVRVSSEIANEIPVVPTGDNRITRINPNPKRLPDRDDWVSMLQEACFLTRKKDRGKNLLIQLKDKFQKVSNHLLQLQEEKQQLQEEKRQLHVNQQLQREKRQLQRDYQQLQERLQELPKILAKEQSWKISHKDVKMTKQELGRGGWGVIWVGEFRGQKVAVKQMHELIASEEFLKLLHREIDTMSQLRHPNLIQFIGAVLDDPSGNPLIITEIMDMSLREAYEKKQLTPVPVNIPLAIMRDVAVGLNYLHCLPDPIIHRDVSSANVLLESKGPGKWKTKISDFGSAKFACAAVTKTVGAIIYSAPEAFQSILDSHDPLTPKMDVFSYGVLLCEVLTCQFPDQQAFKAMLAQVRSQHHSYVYDLIQSCIKRNPQDRPDMDQIIQQLDTI